MNGNGTSDNLPEPSHLVVDREVISAARCFTHTVRTQRIALPLAATSILVWMITQVWATLSFTFFGYVVMPVLGVAFLVGACTYFAANYGRRHAAAEWLVSVRMATFSPPLPPGQSLISWAADLVAAADGSRPRSGGVPPGDLPPSTGE